MAEGRGPRSEEHEEGHLDILSSAFQRTASLPARFSRRAVEVSEPQEKTGWRQLVVGCTPHRAVHASRNGLEQVMTKGRPCNLLRGPRAVAFMEATMRGNRCDVAVTGGGLAGLTAARLLAKERPPCRPAYVARRAASRADVADRLGARGRRTSGVTSASCAHVPELQPSRIDASWLRVIDKALIFASIRSSVATAYPRADSQDAVFVSTSRSNATSSSKLNPSVCSSLTKMIRSTVCGLNTR
jgi:hypothetical protein